ncbi:hypothetical protein DSO57_1004987 [Entomophthora muscae]|uniref:Uncharacterized protein n=1 Tax=Entomophthora muscae TaxID=34485 RepID=A0ACC2SXJ6_9FUNG|nr:hypothetical protein DSO57_1004987 [Entomophthora muscae]
MHLRYLQFIRAHIKIKLPNSPLINQLRGVKNIYTSALSIEVLHQKLERIKALKEPLSIGSQKNSFRTNCSKMQISLNPNGILVLESIASEDQDKVALYKLLLSDFHPFVTSRLQASHFVRERFITINGITTEMPHHILEKGDKVLASFGWRELFKSRIEKFYEAAEPTAFDTLSPSNHHAPAEDCNHLVGSKQGRILVTWKPPGVSPLHVRESVFYRECLERDFDSAQEVLDLFLDYFSNNPCGIKGTDLLYNVEKTIGGLCVVLVSQDGRMAKMINSSKVVRCYHAMCHGRLTEEVQNQLEGQGVKVDQESLRCNEGAICSSSDLLTEFRFSTTALSCGTQIRSLFKESGTPLVGNAKHAVPLKNVSKRGVLLALIGVSFYNPIRKEFQRYEHPEPQKFNCIFYREAAFAKKKQAKDVAEMEKAGVEDVDGLMLEELSDGKPVAYITGLKTFCGHEFHVDANTLIPRPSSEVLVQTVVEIYESQFKPHVDVSCFLVLKPFLKHMALVLTSAPLHWRWPKRIPPPWD